MRLAIPKCTRSSPKLARPSATERSLRATVSGLTIALLAVSLSFTAATAAWHQDEFVIGTWCDPITDLQAYRTASAAGFNLLTGSVYPSAQLEDGGFKALGLASQVGLKLLLTNPGWSTAIGQAPNPFPSDPQVILNPYHGLSPGENDALMGYNLWDEPAYNATNGQYISSWAGAMHADDSLRSDGHPRAVYVNLVNGDATWQQHVTDLLNSYPANAQVDVASVDVYPWVIRANDSLRVFDPWRMYFQRMRELRAVMGTRPFWIASWLGCDQDCGGWVSREAVDGISPADPEQLRFEGFAPAAAGAKGIIWFVYRNTSGTKFQQPAVWYDVIPTPKSTWLTPINMYLRNVVGPVAMTKPHQGIFFQDATNWDAGGVSVANADPALCPVQDLGASNLCVGVFRTAPDQDDYSLLIVNLDLTPKSSTITLRHSYSISKAPSVVGYAGGNTYASAGSGTTFSIQLAGGEGRMYRVSGPRDDLMAVTAPAASEAWLAGEQKLVSWQGGGGPVTVSVYPDAANFDLGDPPAVAAILGIDLTGNSATLTMPAGLYSRRAQLVLTSTAPDGTPQVVTSGAPFNTVPSATTSWSVWTLDRALGVSRSALSLGPDGSPSVATISFDYGGGLISHAAISHFDGNTWSKTTMLWGSIVYPASPLSLAMAVDALARPHIAYVSQKEGGVTGQLQHSNPGNLPGVWYDWKVADLGDIRGGCAMAAIPGTTGSIVLAYNDGNQPVSHLKLMRGETNVIGAITWTNLPTPNVYQPTSIAVAADAAGAIWLACVTEDVPPSSLRVFRITSTGVEQKLAYLGGYERLVDLALDSSGRPRIAFTNQNSAYDPDFVFYRSYNGTSWDPLKVVDTRPKMVSSLAIAMPLDSPRIAYSTGGVVKLASLVGSTWQFEPIGDSEAEGPVSMKCAANGDLWVSFRDVALDQLVVYGPGNPQGTQRSQGARGTVISPAISVVARNPMVPGGAIALAVQAARPSRLEMALYDLAGRRVADFGSHQVAAGSQRVQWQPNGIRAGVYFLRVRMEGVPELHNRLVFIR